MHDIITLKEKLTSKLKELGIEESKIDERLMWSFKKVSFGLMKLRLVLDDKGIDEAKSREIIDKLVDKATKKDLAKVVEDQRTEAARPKRTRKKQEETSTRTKKIREAVPTI
jgi:hypothetical protein